MTQLGKEENLGHVVGLKNMSIHLGHHPFHGTLLWSSTSNSRVVCHACFYLVETDLLDWPRRVSYSKQNRELCLFKQSSWCPSFRNHQRRELWKLISQLVVSSSDRVKKQIISFCLAFHICFDFVKLSRCQYPIFPSSKIRRAWLPFILFRFRGTSILLDDLYCCVGGEMSRCFLYMVRLDLKKKNVI